MRLVSLQGSSGPCAALLREDRVYDIWGEAFAGVRADDRTLEAILEGGLLHEVEAIEDDGVPVDGVTLLPPVTRPGKIVCIGQNYRAHAEEQGAEAAGDADVLRQVPQRAGAPRRHGRAAATGAGWTTRPRWRS